MDNMDDLLNNVKNMMNSGNIPPEVQQMMNNIKSSSSTTSSSQNSSSQNMDINKILSQVSPEMLNNISSMLNSTSSNSSPNNSSNSNNFNLDMNTILKMKSIMENMNNKNDPRANLLYSLKPYLRDSKKDKLDQYVNLLNVSKIAELMNKNNNNNDDKK